MEISTQEFFSLRSLSVIWLALGPTLSYCHGDILTNLRLITAHLLIWPESDRDPHEEVGFQSPGRAHKWVFNKKPSDFESFALSYFATLLN